ncbi:MAG: extracellular solute-binding protein [Oscillospiraceae bacterium]|jgi:putative aldouronate transport system substrate-binding protein|nr:extracellular solute-binding protein [Oscillospiraceae bacterium]
MKRSKCSLLWLAVALAMAMVIGVAGAAAAPSPDISKHVKLTMYLLGDEQTDEAKVLEALNVQLQEKLNVTLDVKYLSWGDYMTKYSLILAAGEGVDLIYTSSWAFFTTEANKGAFFELTPEFLETYMPLTMASQAEASWSQASIGGKIFAVPRNNTGLEFESYVMIRKDLREKYGMEPPNSLETLEAYFKAVVDNEQGILPYAADYDAGGFYAEAFSQPNSYWGVGPGWGYSYTETGTGAPEFDQLEYTWLSERIIPYFELMQKWANMGFWSKNAISNQEATRGAFENGKSASLGQNPGTLYNAGKNLSKNNPEWTYEVLDVNPGTPRQASMYNGDMIAIADASANPERAAMLLDLLKNDLDVYLGLVGGIEGEHYVINEDGSRGPGPSAEKYTWDPGTWGLRWNDSLLPVDASASPEQTAFEREQKVLLISPESTNFIFDSEPVKNEYAALTALSDEYTDMFHLGIVADIRATQAEWKAKAEAAGLAVVEAELKTQYEAWKATLGD